MSERVDYSGDAAHPLGPLFVALTSALAEMTNPGTDADADMGTYRIRYTTLAGLLDHVRPVLARHGLGVMSDVSGSDGYVSVETVFVHACGVYSTGPLVMSAGRGAQAAGSAISYARRYQLAAACGIATDTDDDGKAAQRSVDEHPLASAAQIALLNRRMKDHGLTDRADRLDWVAMHLGRRVASSKELTTHEAGQLIDALASPSEGDA